MTIDALFEQLKHPNPHMKKRAMYDLAEVRDETTIPLGVIGVDAVPSLVETLLNSQNTTIKGSCVKALAQISLNHPEVTFPEMGLQGLKQSLNDPDPVVYIASAMALGQIGTPAIDILVESLKTTDNLALSIAIINALGSIGDRRGIEVLTELAKDQSVDEYLRESATSALARLDFVNKS
jgi:bilin biosynthesis protein